MPGVLLKWGIAAAGRITHDFVTALNTIEAGHHAVVAVADVEAKRAQRFAQRHGIPKFYDGFDALSQDREVAVVYVGTLNPYHYAVVFLMLQRGKHVLCEKPLCMRYEQAAELYRLAKTKGVFLMEGMWCRFFPSYRRLSEQLLANCIGQVQHIQVQHGFRAATMERVLSRALGGSIMLEIGVYALQLGQFVYDCMPQSVKCSAQLNAEGVDVECELVLSYGENRKLMASLSGLRDSDNYAKIVGSNGEIKLPNYWCCTTLIKPQNITENWILPTAGALQEGYNYTNAAGLSYQAEEVRHCIENGLLESPLYTHAQSLELLRLTEEIHRQVGVTYDDIFGHEL